MGTSTAMLKYWWQKHADEIRDNDDLYSSFEKAWEAAQHYLLLSMREWTPGQIGDAIREARLEEAVVEKDMQHVEAHLSFLEFDRKRLERAKKAIEEASQ